MIQKILKIKIMYLIHKDQVLKPSQHKWHLHNQQAWVLVECSCKVYSNMQCLVWFLGWWEACLVAVDLNNNNNNLNKVILHNKVNRVVTKMANKEVIHLSKVKARDSKVITSNHGKSQVCLIKFGQCYHLLIHYLRDHLLNNIINSHLNSNNRIHKISSIDNLKRSNNHKILIKWKQCKKKWRDLKEKINS